MLVREMKPGDIEAGERLCRSSGWNQVASDWSLFLQLNPAGCLVAEKNGTVVGTVASLRYGEQFSWLAMVLVDPRKRRQGIGTRLVQTLLDLADQWLLLRRVELTVLTENEGAKHLYERLGFVVEGCRKMSVISQGELKDEWLMARYR